MYSNLPPLVTQGDIYGQGSGGGQGSTTGSLANPASSPSSTGNQGNGPAIALVGLVIAMFLLRVAWEMGGEPGS